MSNKKMNPEVKRRWIEALRSGKYQQSRKYLHDENGFCCLGVLCDLREPAWAPFGSDIDDLSPMTYRWMNEEYDEEILPDTVAEWAGCENDPLIPIDVVLKYAPELKDKIYEYEKRRGSIHISQLNDRGATFEQITMMIEEAL